MKFKIHPLFAVLVILSAFSGGGLGVLWGFVAVLLHELGHILVARARGYLVKSVVLLPYGAEMSARESFDPTSSVLIGLAGPVTNLFLAVFTLGLWWVFPSAYPYTKSFLYANLSLAFFNLLPVYPLDGGRVLMGIAKNKLKALKILKVLGVLVSLSFVALFILSIFYGINFSFLTTAIFLFYGAISGGAEDSYVSIFSPLSKDYELGVEEKTVIISKDVPLSRLLRFSTCTTKVTFRIEDGGRVKTIAEEKVKEYALIHKLSTPIGKIVFGN